MPELRAAYPYYLYDAIRAQPALIEKVLARRDAIERAADAMAEKERITFVGIGTSLHNGFGRSLASRSRRRCAHHRHHR